MSRATASSKMPSASLITSQGSPMTDHELVRGHSFQLVKLQSELHGLRLQRNKDAQDNDKLAAEMRGLYACMADLRGKLASLTMEMHALSRVAAPVRRESASASLGQRAVNTSENSWALVDGEDADGAGKDQTGKPVEAFTSL